MPTGGVDPSEENLKAWFDAGVFCVGMGSKMITKDFMKNKEYDKLTKKCRETLELIRRIRNK
jgi:2-dehydro-3-deoxyphosphogluconate aldolase/(4S)-4-hydroxy-2-oxoglutarate aldolase